MDMKKIVQILMSHRPKEVAKHSRQHLDRIFLDRLIQVFNGTTEFDIAPVGTFNKTQRMPLPLLFMDEINSVNKTSSWIFKSLQIQCTTERIIQGVAGQYKLNCMEVFDIVDKSIGVSSIHLIN